MVPEATQLLRANLWPATWEEPQTFYTFGVLRLFHELSFMAHTNVYDFYRSLTRLQDEVLPQDCKVTIFHERKECKMLKMFVGPISRVHDVSQGVQLPLVVYATRH